jgi:hypothetical protein
VQRGGVVDDDVVRHNRSGGVEEMHEWASEWAGGRCALSVRREALDGVVVRERQVCCGGGSVVRWMRPSATSVARVIRTKRGDGSSVPRS